MQALLYWGSILPQLGPCIKACIMKGCWLIFQIHFLYVLRWSRYFYPWFYQWTILCQGITHLWMDCTLSVPHIYCTILACQGWEHVDTNICSSLMCCQFVLLLFNWTMSRSLILSQSESMMSVTCGATKGHTNAWDLDHILCLCWWPRATQPLGQSCCRGLFICVHDPTAARVCWCSWHLIPPRQCWCQGSGLLPGTMIGSKGHIAIGAMLLYSMLLPGIMVAQQQPGSGLISMACVITGSHKKHACWNPRAMWSQPWPSLAPW